jgi:polyisoprenoid-binding protein YceI
MANPGHYTLGPDTGTLSVRTGKAGAAAMAGHNLLIEVSAWEAHLELADDPAASALSLSVDSASLRVLEGTGGVQTLGEEDKEGIKATIDKDVLKGTAIAFRSTEISGGDGALHVTGELELSGRTHPLSFELALGDDGALTGSARLKQSNWGMKPYSALFGTLKVTDEVEVAIDAHLPA